MAAFRIPALLLLGVLTFATFAATTQAKLPSITGPLVNITEEAGGDIIITSLVSGIGVEGSPTAPGRSPGRKLLRFTFNPTILVNSLGGEGVTLNGTVVNGIGLSVENGPTKAPGPSPGRKLLQVNPTVSVNSDGEGVVIMDGSLDIGIGLPVENGPANAPGPSPGRKF